MKIHANPVSAIVVALLLGIWCAPAPAQEDEFAAFEEMEKKAFAAFEEMEQGTRTAWETREKELARAWEEEWRATLASFGETEKAAKDDPLKKVETDAARRDQIAQSQVDFESGKVRVEAVVVAPTAEEARRKAEKLAREKLKQATQQVPADGDQTIAQQAEKTGSSAQQEQALDRIYDEKEKVTARLPDGQVEAKVTLEQPLTGENGLTALALATEKEEEEQKPPPPPPSAKEIVRAKGPFTGLLLDASGASGARPSLVPTVRAQDGSLVYGPARVEKEKAIHGMADWLRTEVATKNSKRLGDNPLTVQVAAVQRGGRLVVSDADAALIRAADRGFLADCMVAIQLGK